MTRVERILTPERLNELWPQMRPLFDRCVQKACKGELVVDDIKALALANRAYVFVEVDAQQQVTVALAMELIQYPRMATVNILALGGKDLMGAADKFFDVIKHWLMLNGVTAIDAWASPGMTRLLTRKLNFKHIYQHLRLELGGNHEV